MTASPLRTEVVRMDDRLVLGLFGELRHRDTADLRRVLLKCLAEQPAVVVVDLSGVVLLEPLGLSIFATVARDAETWPGASMMLCTSDPQVALVLAGGGYGRLPVFGSAAEALAAGPGRGVPSISDVLLPASGAARHARALAHAGCDRWELPHLADGAAAVVGELVANAVRHAGTMMDVRFSRGRHYLLIAVRDGSDRLPRPTQDGLGLRLVDGLSRRWGSFPAAGGKVVWAALAAA